MEKKRTNSMSSSHIGAMYSQICTINIKKLFWLKRTIILLRFKSFLYNNCHKNGVFFFFCHIGECVVITISYFRISACSSISIECLKVYVSPLGVQAISLYPVTRTKPSRQLWWWSVSAVEVCLDCHWFVFSKGHKFPPWPNEQQKTSSASAFASDCKTTPGPRSFSGPISRLSQLSSPMRASAARQNTLPTTSSPAPRWMCVFSFCPLRWKSPVSTFSLAGPSPPPPTRPLRSASRPPCCCETALGTRTGISCSGLGSRPRGFWGLPGPSPRLPVSPRVWFSSAWTARRTTRAPGDRARRLRCFLPARRASRAHGGACSWTAGGGGDDAACGW